MCLYILNNFYILVGGSKLQHEVVTWLRSFSTLKGLIHWYLLLILKYGHVRIG